MVRATCAPACFEGTLRLVCGLFFSSDLRASCAEPCPSENTSGEEEDLADVRTGADGGKHERGGANGLSGSAFDLGLSRGAHPDPGRNVVLRIEAETEMETRVCASVPPESLG